jgi:hypothetical protein
VSKINSLKHRLQRLIEVVAAKHPDKVHLIPTPDSISIDKLGNDGVVMTDTCNGAQKLRRLLVDRIDGSHDLDCMNHLRNVWIGGMEKSLSKYLNDMMRSNLDDIDSKLRVTTSISAVIRAIDKEFSLSANYPKGHGELFLEWIREHYSGVLLLHVERASGSRQDLCTEGCLAIYMNYEYYVEFLDEMLRKKVSNEHASILQQNLFVILTSVEMLALSRLLSIIHLSISMPFRYLAGKTHEFKRYGWGAADMSRVIDTLYIKLREIHENPSLVLNENFMMNIFEEYRNKLPPFKDYWELMYDKKQMKVVCHTDGSSVVHYKRIRNHLFHPTKKSDVETTEQVIELSRVATEALLRELLDEKKATYKYLSLSGSDYSAVHEKYESRQQALLGVTATNDEAESVLGGITSNVQRYGRIHLSSAGAVSDTKRNKLLSRGKGSKDGESSRGLFHELDDVIREAIVLVALKDAPKTRKRHSDELESHARARRVREELIRERNDKKMTEDYIDALYYHKMYNSDACWRGSPGIVSRELKKLSSDRAKYTAVKENIRMRVKGLGWDWCEHAWSKNGRKYTVYELAKHLQMIIKKEKSLVVPNKPPLIAPTRISLPVLGTQSSQVAALDEKYLSNESDIRRKAEQTRRERENRGEGSMHSQLQPFSRPELKDLVQRRIDVLYAVELEDSTNGLRWCQGKVISVIDDKKVRVDWDPAPDIAGSEAGGIGEARLLPSKWNKDNIVGAWRLDVDICEGDELDDGYSTQEEEEIDSSDSELEEGSVE